MNEFNTVCRGSLRFLFVWFFSTCIFLSTSPLQSPQTFISPSPCNNVGYSSHWYYLLFIFTKVTFRRGKKDSFLAVKDDGIYRKDFTFLPILDLIFSFFFFIEPCEFEKVVCFKLNSTTLNSWSPIICREQPSGYTTIWTHKKCLAR